MWFLCFRTRTISILITSISRISQHRYNISLYRYPLGPTYIKWKLGRRLPWVRCNSKAWRVRALYMVPNKSLNCKRAPFNDPAEAALTLNTVYYPHTTIIRGTLRVTRFRWISQQMKQLETRILMVQWYQTQKHLHSRALKMWCRKSSHRLVINLSSLDSEM